MQSEDILDLVTHVFPVAPGLHKEPSASQPLQELQYY